MSEDFCYLLLSSIPNDFHSKDLRNFFSSFIDGYGFECFHYRHRPESLEFFQSIGLSKSDISICEQACCCLIKLKLIFVEGLVNSFHETFWTSEHTDSYHTKPKFHRVKIKDEKQYIEFQVPSIIPQGNVGTPTSYIKKQIAACNFPASLIKKLGILSRNSEFYLPIYGKVDFDYNSLKSISSNSEGNDLQTLAKTINNFYGFQTIKNTKTVGKDADDYSIPIFDNESEPEEDWDRHCAFEDDVDEQGRIKERKYEEEMEVVWEKGGSGLVFYTDAAHWHYATGMNDFDEMTSDHWDVDMSRYEKSQKNENFVDYDSRQLHQMRKMKKLVDGGELDHSSQLPEIMERRGKRKGGTVSKERCFGEFERFTRGFGSRIMKNYGWVSGKPLGMKDYHFKRLVSPLIPDARLSSEIKFGVGFCGDKIERHNFKSQNRSIHKISTIYDDPNVREISHSGDGGILQRNEQEMLKHRVVQRT